MGHSDHAILGELAKSAQLPAGSTHDQWHKVIDQLWEDTCYALNERLEDTGMDFGGDPPRGEFYGSNKRYYIAGAIEPDLFVKALGEWSGQPLRAALFNAEWRSFREKEGRPREELERTPGLKILTDQSRPGWAQDEPTTVWSGYPRANPLLTTDEIHRIWFNEGRVIRPLWSEENGAEEAEPADEAGPLEQEIDTMPRPAALSDPSNADLLLGWDSWLTAALNLARGVYLHDSGFFSVPHRTSKLVPDEIREVNEHAARYALLFYDVRF
jgi:hypothetical protein